MEERACLVSEPLDSTPGFAAPTVTLAPSVTTLALNFYLQIKVGTKGSPRFLTALK